MFEGIDYKVLETQSHCDHRNFGNANQPKSFYNIQNNIVIVI